MLLLRSPITLGGLEKIYPSGYPRLRRVISLSRSAKKTAKKSISTTLAETLDCPGISVPRGNLETLNISPYHAWKRVWEFPIALILAAPALLVTAFLIVMVRVTSRGPGIYAQNRTGLNGKVFQVLKLRSMYHDAEKWGAQWSSGSKDPRVTPLGRWLRKLHLDELPQIINVLKGEMSFCGPRPERPEFVSKLEASIPYYVSRLTVRPGITGFAQINLPPDVTLLCVHKKQTLDLEYIENASFWSDLKMIFCTALRLLGISGLAASHVCGLVMVPADSRFSFYYQDDSSSEEGIENAHATKSGSVAVELAST